MRVKMGTDRVFSIWVLGNPWTCSWTEPEAKILPELKWFGAVMPSSLPGGIRHHPGMPVSTRSDASMPGNMLASLLVHVGVLGVAPDGTWKWWGHTSLEPSNQAERSGSVQGKAQFIYPQFRFLKWSKSSPEMGKVQHRLWFRFRAVPFPIWEPVCHCVELRSLPKWAWSLEDFDTPLQAQKKGRSLARRRKTCHLKYFNSFLHYEETFLTGHCVPNHSRITAIYSFPNGWKS